MTGVTPSADEVTARGALVVPRLDRGTLVVTGHDRATWLNGVVTCDVAAVNAELGALGLVLTRTGKITSDLWIVAAGDALYLSVAPGRAGELHAHLERMLVMEDAEIADQSDAFAWLSLHGPRALELALSQARDSGCAAGSLTLPGPKAVALVVPRDRLDAVSASLAARGPEVVIADVETWQRFRVVHGIGSFGVDFGVDDNPHEAGLDQLAVSWTKGCYLGQEVVCMQGMRGKLKRRLVSLFLRGGGVPTVGAQVSDGDGHALGEVTSVAAADDGAFVLARVSGPGIDAKIPLFVAGAAATIVEQPAGA